MILIRFFFAFDRIASGLNNLSGSPKLTNLNLSGNKIKDFEELKPLTEFSNLTTLDLFNNELTATENYKQKIFELIPSLKYLDGFDAEENECVSEGEDEDIHDEEGESEGEMMNKNSILVLDGSCC